MELTAIITGVLITVGASWSWPAWVPAAWVAGHPDLLRAAGRWTGELVGWLWWLAAMIAAPGRWASQAGAR